MLLWYEKNEKDYPARIRRPLHGGNFLIRKQILTSDRHVFHHHDVLSCHPSALPVWVFDQSEHVLVWQGALLKTLQTSTKAWQGSFLSNALVHGVCNHFAPAGRLLYALKRNYLFILQRGLESRRESCNAWLKAWSGGRRFRVVIRKLSWVGCSCVQQWYITL